jgi:hypothetical protein
MESSQDQIEDQAVEEAHNLGEQEQLLSTPPVEDIKVEFVVARKKIRGEKKAKHPVKKSKRVIIESSESEFSEGSDSESESSSEDGRSKRKRKQKLAARRAAAKKKQRAKLRARSTSLAVLTQAHPTLVLTLNMRFSSQTRRAAGKLSRPKRTRRGARRPTSQVMTTVTLYQAH